MIISIRFKQQVRVERTTQSWVELRARLVIGILEQGIPGSSRGCAGVACLKYLVYRLVQGECLGYWTVM